MEQRSLQRILMVDDEKDIQTVARLALEAVGGFTVEVCSSGAEAIQRAPEFQPDLILLDVMMPLMDGPATLQALRELPQTARTPVVFMTAKAQSSEVARYRALGALAVIAKPFDPMALSATISEIWDGQRPPAPDGLQEQLQVLRQTYVMQLDGRVRQLEDHVHSLVHGSGQDGTPHAWNRDTLRAVHHGAHSMTGSGATFGFASLSEAARALEVCALSCLEGEVAPTAEAYARLESLVAGLKAAAGAAISRTAIVRTNSLAGSLPPVIMPPVGEPDAEGDLSAGLPEAGPPADALRITPFPGAGLGGELDASSLLTGEPTFTLEETATGDKRTIFLVEDDPQMARDIAQQIGHFGYQVRSFASPDDPGDELRAAIRRTPPAAVIMDITSPDGDLAAPEIVQSIQKAGPYPVPVLFLSERGDLEARLHAVRAGAKAYFTKPVDTSGLIDELDRLTVRSYPDPLRILICDDEPELARLFALILERAGMKTAVVTDPLDIMQPVVDFRPDLILMDVYMPECNGLEVATVIRQQEAYVSIPIVFLSAETNLSKQLQAMHLGGDDFLTKPIQPDHLVSSVAARAQRSRVLRSFMVRDSLTGLLNHTRLKEQLQIEVSRARRQNGVLSFAMLDIDHFKNVNDTYGHLIGDRVLKNMARLLQQRLRRTDIIGRYGGEEFAVILTGANAESAMRVLDGIRSGFAQILHRSQDAEFSVTFSGGIACLPPHEDATRLNDAADKALYEAKRTGRNRVVLAS